MSSRTDRAVVVFPDVPEAVSAAGGTMARILEAGGSATLVTASATDAASEAALARLAGADHLVSPPDRLSEVLDARDATVVIVGPTASALRAAAIDGAEARGLPVYVALTGRTTAPRSPGTARPGGDHELVIDIGRQRDGKRDALAVLLPAGATVDDHPSEVFERRGEVIDAPATGWGTRLTTAALALIVGVIFGTVGTVAHTTSVEVAGITIPWGLIVSIIGVAALLVGLRMVIRDRLVVGACVIGLIGTVALFTLRSVGGSVIIPQTTASVVWTIAPALIAAVVLAWPTLPPRATQAHRA